MANNNLINSLMGNHRWANNQMQDNGLNSKEAMYNKETKDLEANKADMEANKADMEANKVDMEVNKVDMGVNKGDMVVNKGDMEEIILLIQTNDDKRLKIKYK